MSPVGCAGWADPWGQAGEAREAGIDMPALDMEPLLVSLPRFPWSPLGMQTAGGSEFRGRAGQEEAREVREVTGCHVGKQARARDEGAWCRDGQEMLAPASQSVHRPCPCSEGTRQAGLAGEEVIWGARQHAFLQDGLRVAPEQTWHCRCLSRKPGPLGETKHGRPLCGHRGVRDTSTLGCFLVTGQLRAVPPLTRSPRCSWPSFALLCSLSAVGDVSYSAAASFQAEREMSHSSTHAMGKGRSPADAHVRSCRGEPAAEPTRTVPGREHNQGAARAAARSRTAASLLLPFFLCVCLPEPDGGLPSLLFCFVSIL